MGFKDFNPKTGKPARKIRQIKMYGGRGDDPDDPVREFNERQALEADDRARAKTARVESAPHGPYPEASPAAKLKNPRLNKVKGGLKGAARKLAAMRAGY